jgi:glutaredoxin
MASRAARIRLLGLDSDLATSKMNGRMWRFVLSQPMRFRTALAVALGLAFVFLNVGSLLISPQPTTSLAWQQDGRLHVFFHPDCPHCHKAIEFLRSQPQIDFDLHDVSSAANETLLRLTAEHNGIAERDLGVPLFVRGSRYLIGFESAETTGRELVALAADEGAIVRPETRGSHITLPLIGVLDPSRYSLLSLTVLMGLSDGFNPCAMWVLVYLISLIAGLQDRGKIWWLVGTFCCPPVFSISCS